MKPRFSTHEKIDAVQQFYAAGNISQIEFAKKIGISRRQFQRWCKKFKHAEAADEYVPFGQELRGVSTLYKDGEEVIKWVKTNKSAEEQRQALVQIATALSNDLKPVARIKPPKICDEDLLAVYPFGDPHIGLYCWSEEVGEDFDLDIAQRDMQAAFQYHIDRGEDTKRALILNVGDFFHAPNMGGTTPRSGHVLDMAGRAPHMIMVGVRILRYCIERAAEKHEIVEVINSVGNHDDILSYALSIMLAEIYADNPRIIIHAQPTTRHYIQHGLCMFGATHGDRTKDQSLPGIMATEQPVMWGETKFRVFFRGHHHHDSIKEYNGCKVEQFRTLAPGDSYAVGGGWLSGRDLKRIIYHKQYGEVARATCSIDMLRPMQ